MAGEGLQTQVATLKDKLGFELRLINMGQDQREIKVRAGGEGV